LGKKWKINSENSRKNVSNKKLAKNWDQKFGKINVTPTKLIFKIIPIIPTLNT
jgi:hypothetical protein